MPETFRFRTYSNLPRFLDPKWCFVPFYHGILFPRSLLPRKEWADINASWMTTKHGVEWKASPVFQKKVSSLWNHVFWYHYSLSRRACFQMFFNHKMFGFVELFFFDNFGSWISPELFGSQGWTKVGVVFASASGWWIAKTWLELNKNVSMSKRLKSLGLPPPPPRKLTCLLKRDHLVMKFHLPTINFRRICEFSGGCIMVWSCFAMLLYRSVLFDIFFTWHIGPRFELGFPRCWGSIYASHSGQNLCKVTSHDCQSQ